MIANTPKVGTERFALIRKRCSFDSTYVEVAGSFAEFFKLLLDVGEIAVYYAPNNVYYWVRYSREPVLYGARKTVNRFLKEFPIFSETSDGKYIMRVK